jgi:hypothetical protein
VIDAGLKMCKVVIILLIWTVKSAGNVLRVVDLAGKIYLEKILIIVEIDIIIRKRRHDLGLV